MATRDTGGQSQSGRSRRDDEVDDAAAPAVDPEVAERQEKKKLTEDVDDLLTRSIRCSKRTPRSSCAGMCRRVVSDVASRPKPGRPAPRLLARVVPRRG